MWEVWVRILQPGSDHGGKRAQGRRRENAIDAALGYRSPTRCLGEESTQYFVFCATGVVMDLPVAQEKGGYILLAILVP